MINWPWKNRPLSQSKKNDLVRKQLAKYGDAGRTPRHVIHFAYPTDVPDVLSLVDVKAALRDLDFRFTETEESRGLVFEHEREVASVAFDELTESLRQRFTSMGWEYDGWECAVDTDE